MTTVFQFAALGLGTGAAYALLAQGLVIVHRGSGVVNFAHGGVAIFAALLYTAVSADQGVPRGLAAALIVGAAALFGAVMYVVAVRPLRNASTLAQTIATLAVLIILESVASLLWGTSTRLAPSILPKEVRSVGDIAVPENRMVLVAIAVAMTGALWALYRFTLFGQATSAVSENTRASAALGWSPDRLAATNWALGASLGAFAGILLASTGGTSVADMTTFLVIALAAALLGKLSSFPWVLAGSLVLGVTQSIAGNYVTRQGVAESIPFFVIVLVLVFQGRKLPLPSAKVERFAEVGTGTVRPKLVLTLCVVFCLLTLTVFGADLQAALAASLGFSIVALSIVVLTGYAGQLSLAQFAFGGIGTLITAKLVGTLGWPLEVALIVGVAAAVPVGLVFALLALRVRGVTLAIVTLGLGAALTAIVFVYSPITGGPDGTPVGPQTFLGIDIDAASQPGRYLVLVAIVFTLCAVAIANLRRSRAGRRLVAVRANERAAAALGVNVYQAKLYAFGLAAGVAALGGIMLGFQYQTILYEGVYTPFQSILAVAFTVVGGLGYIGGALIAGTLTKGGFGPFVLEAAYGGIDRYMALIGGILLLVLLVRAPDGLAPAKARAAQLLLNKRRARRPSASVQLPSVQSSLMTASRVKPRQLQVCDLRVQFGGVTALDGVSVTVQPGKVTGLIGPNGAGKTTLINAVTGFVAPSSGTILLDGRSIADWPVHRRARAGLGRTFQSLELFEDLSVRENVRVGADERDLAVYFSGLVRPRDPQLPPAALLAIQEFGLEDTLEQLPTELPYGRRRMVAIARTLALEPSVLMLDEPATGLDEGERQGFGALIRRLADNWGLAILIIEHDVDLMMSICDSLTVLDFGRQIADGDPASVRRDPSVIAAYLGEPEAVGPTSEAPIQSAVRS
jgi:ABC-type branched-subunit amino acid transport system ATPase component/branched-subunit amino acid ABC-type transport system permease component